MFKSAASFVYLLPRNLLALVLMAYRKVISPLYGDVCRYYPTCSQYGLGAIQERGVIMGTVLTARRLVRCNPWSRGGIDDVPPAKHHHFTINRLGLVVLNKERA